MAKLLAMYLPQFHEFKENNEWWGNGYTEWSAVKSSKPLFKGHYQPHIPLNKNYYDLSDSTAKAFKWQAELAKKYGIDGFCIYNYWFLGHQLMEKPLDILYEHKDIQLNYCICWANETWTRTWYGLEKEILIEQTYGDCNDWKKHYQYLSKFFKDPRYIKRDNKPVLCIYHTKDIDELDKMIDLWTKLAIDDGFNGIYLISGNTNAFVLEDRDELVDAYYNFEPGYSLKHKQTKFEDFEYYFSTFFKQNINRIKKKKILEIKLSTEKVYKQCIKQIEKTNKKVFYGIFPEWDNTPRRKYKGLVYNNSSPKLFGKYLGELISRVDKNDFIFINAWNEWGEGAYLEPDTKHKYEYLEEIKKQLEINEER